MSRIKYIGRPSPWKGKTLYDIACNLKNYASDRVVTRWSIHGRYPEKSYYRLTKVEPDLTDPEFMKGRAWGYKVFRGEKFEVEGEICTGHRADWILIPREEEEEFCKISEKDVRTKKSFPTHTKLPPLLEALYKQDLVRRGQSPNGEVKVELKLHKSLRKRKDTQ